MSESSLPKEYKGFSTTELLEIWKNIPNRTMYDPPTPEEKVSAMRDLFNEYRLLHFGDDKNEPEEIRRCKQLMAPFGIDPAPWMDENGIAQPELSEAYAERSRQEESERRKRIKALQKKYKFFWCAHLTKEDEPQS